MQKIYTTFFVGLNYLRCEINADNSRTPIKQLCISENQQVHFLSMKSALPLDEILFKFDTMSRNYSTELFHAIWKFHMDAAHDTASKTGKKLVIEDIKTKIWDPTFVECSNLLSAIKDRSIKLTVVDHYFRHLKNREMQLHRLQIGVQECSGIERHTAHSNIEWIETAVHLMKEYWSLLSLGGAARTIMALKRKLNLSGDFSFVDSIAKKVIKFSSVLQ